MSKTYVVILGNDTEIEVSADGYNVDNDKRLVMYEIDGKGECKTVLTKRTGEWKAFYCREETYEDWMLI